MNKGLVAAGAIAVVALGSPAFAQFGSLSKAQKGLKRVEQAQDLVITDSEEQQIGSDVSLRLRMRFGVVQDRDVHRYVTSVGLLLAHETDRASLPWRFVVLDTDGVNAFASPGGFIHITRGALALIKNEAELAGVLGHEITHVTERHTINAIRKSKAVQIGADEAGGNKGLLVKRMASKVYEMVIENSFDRGDENEADEKGVRLAAKAGYAPAGLADFLARLADRNKNQTERNGLFASHPETQERIGKIRQEGAGLKGSNALVAARYHASVTYEPAALTEVPQVTEGAAGLAGGSTKSSEPDAKPAEEEKPKKKGFGLSSLKKAITPQQQSAQVSASGGARGVGPDRNAKGGPNPAVVTVTLTAADLAAFKKGIA
jgi:predicted Zn-dependent protease